MDNYELIIKSLITLIFAIWTGIIIPYIRSKIDEKKWEKMEKYAEVGVRTAEQLFEQNQVKREWVYEYLIKKANEVNIELTEQDISNLVEYTVNLVKYGQPYTRE